MAQLAHATGSLEPGAAEITEAAEAQKGGAP
jgi:hypothetical protein